MINKLGILLFLFSLLSTMYSCAEKAPTPSQHPLEKALLPNIQIADAPKSYTIEERMATHEIPGFALGIIENNELRFTKGYGFARRKDSIRVAPQSIFAAGSISKSIVGLVVLMLEEQGHLSLDKDISTYLQKWQVPENKFTSEEKITLRHLLNHTAGINPFNSRGLSQAEVMPSLVEVLSGEGDLPGVRVDTIPGAQYKYSNLGYGVIQLIIEDITGQPLQEIAKALVLEPLGMSQSTFSYASPSAASAQYVYAYDREGAVYDGFWRKSLIPASGGLKSTIGDLAKLLLSLSDALAGKQNAIIPEAMAKQIIAQNGYHLGFEIDGEEEGRSISHTGRVPGFFAYMRLYLHTGNGIILLCNSDNGGALFKDVLRGASAMYSWDILHPKVIDVLDLPFDALKQYLGDYRLLLNGDEYIIQILPDGDQLKYKMKDEEEEYPIRAVEPGVFIDLIDGERFRFVMEKEVAVQLVIDEEYTYERLID